MSTISLRRQQIGQVEGRSIRRHLWLPRQRLSCYEFLWSVIFAFVGKQVSCQSPSQLDYLGPAGAALLRSGANFHHEDPSFGVFINSGQNVGILSNLTGTECTVWSNGHIADRTRYFDFSESTFRNALFLCLPAANLAWLSAKLRETIS